MRRLIALAALCGALTGSCGTAAPQDLTLGALVGPSLLSLPIFDDGALKTLALRNLTSQAAPVRLNWRPRGGVPTDDDVTIAAFGELRLPVPFDDGWIVVDTNDPLTSMPIATTGFVEPFLWASRGGPDVETCPAATLHDTEHVIPIHPRTARVSLLNHDAAPQTYTVCAFDTTGFLQSVVLHAVGADDSVLLNDFAVLPQGVGHLSIIPPGTMPTFSIASQEDDDLVYEVNEQIALTSRLLDAGATSLASLGVEWGRDTLTGRTLDFDLLMVNGTETEKSFTVHWVYDEFGSPVKMTPVTISVPARRSRLYRTTVADSIGLEPQELHPFAAHFGDAFSATSLKRYSLHMSLAEGLFATARVFDPFALDAVMRVRPTAYAHSASALVSELQNTTLGGVLDTLLIHNPSTGPIDVNVRAFTPEKGTQYVLGSLVVPPRSVLAWSADALGLREDPGDVFNPPVRHLRLLLTSNVPFGLQSRQIGRSADELLVFVTPHIIRIDD